MNNKSNKIKLVVEIDKDDYKAILNGNEWHLCSECTSLCKELIVAVKNSSLFKDARKMRDKE